ncbi:MAG: hypothetical protein JG773_977 [Spirochaeta sp.]|nr:hypothetical protein [Spirochaeta sp.]
MQVARTTSLCTKDGVCPPVQQVQPIPKMDRWISLNARMVATSVWMPAQFMQTTWNLRYTLLPSRRMRK